MISAARPLSRFLPRRSRTVQRQNGAAAGQTLFSFFGRGKTAAITAFSLEAYLCQTQVRGRSTAEPRPVSSNRGPVEAPPPQTKAASHGNDRNAASATGASAHWRNRQADKPAAPRRAQERHHPTTSPVPFKAQDGTKYEAHLRRCGRAKVIPAGLSPNPRAVADPTTEVLPRGHADRQSQA
jgi:hypothetical protein